MGELADRVGAMTVRATSPDGAITAELRDRDHLTLAFPENWYQLCADSDLERRLSALAPLLFVERTRQYWRIFSDVTGQEVTGGDKPISERDIQWQQERDELVARGSSADGRVSVTTVGMRSWEVRLTPGTVRALSEQQFMAAVSEAAAALIQDQTARIAALSNKYYGYDR